MHSELGDSINMDKRVNDKRVDAVVYLPEASQRRRMDPIPGEIIAKSKSIKVETP